MRKIYYKDDFEFDIRLTDLQSKPYGIPPFDFEIRLWSVARDYSAGRKDGELYNIKPSMRGDEWLTVVVDNHGLFPCKELVAEIILQIPNDDYPDGKQQIVRKYRTGISLTVSDSDIPGEAEIEMLMPFIKGEKGDRGEIIDLAELSDDEVKELRKRLGIEDISELTPEEIADIAEREYKLYINP
ncbi:MAG: hypothetical protein K2M03_07875 [Muribaculaceae bacterium]|nr:hypothetical protein [Muribaculaceae bacterium]